MARWSSEPAFAPSIAVTAATAGAETVHVMWSTESQTDPITDDVMWYANWTGQPWPPPANYLAALGSRNPRLAVGPQNHLHAAFMSYHPSQNSYDADYVERLTDDESPLPPPENDPNQLLFPTAFDMNDLGLAVSRGADGLERGHVVWSEYSGGNRPALYYGRAQRQPNSLATTGEALGPLGAAGCLDPSSSSPDCYRGYKPSVAVLTRPGGAGQDLVVVWEGRDNFAPATPVIYAGTRRLCPPDQTCLWTSPQPVSNNQLSKRSKTSQMCGAQNPQPALRAIAPSIALSPRSTLHAIWLQQLQADGPYYVHTARLVYDQAAQDYCWDYYETIPVEPVPAESVRLARFEPPRLAFDQQRRRYAVWNVGFQRVVVATSDLDTAASTADYDAYRPWQAQGRINTAECAGENGVRGVDVAARESGSQFVHVVWTAVNSGADRGRICYARLGYGYQTFVPRIDKAGSLRH
ncbi:MAG: hypothetical protein KIT87_09120 [Anaerolineae bacterium]|nr:hypothetical protein [Anaerolineae bacterium]